MAQTVPPLITAAPTPAPQRNNRTTFSGLVDAFVTWLITAVTQFGAVATNVYNNAVDAYNNSVATAANAAAAATSATNAANSVTAAAAAAGAVVWVSGTTYALGNNVYSPVNFLTYRRKVAGAGTTDPSLDTTNWLLVGGATPWVTKTAAYTALSGDRIKADTLTTGAFTITLPAAPNEGDQIEVQDVKANFDVANLSLSGNTKTIMGFNTFVLNRKYLHASFVYDALSNDWKI